MPAPSPLGSLAPVRWPVLAPVLLLLLLLAGCGYAIRPPYETRVQTVYVPVFKSISFRRDLNMELTEMVQKEIEQRTPYKVVGRPDGADSTLEGTVVYSEKYNFVENPNNLPRQILGSVMISVRWIDNTTGAVVQQRELPPVPVYEYAMYYPELGETSQLGFRKSMTKLSRDIVNMMEEPW